MGRPLVTIDLARDGQCARDLSAGGAFVASCELALDTECELVLRAGSDEQRYRARIVYVAPTGGAGLEIVGFNPAVKEQLSNLMRAVGPASATEPQSITGCDERSEKRHVPTAKESPSGTVAAPAPAPPAHAIDPARSDSQAGAADAEPAPASDAAEDAEDADDAEDAEHADPEARRIARNVHERLRGLTLAEQIKAAHAGEPSERIVLERLYGKNVWEPLLRNPRLTAPEVARIARMGALPRPLIELIVGNGAWLQVPEVRRALLNNPRLGTDQIIRLLRLMPKHELKLAATQTAYPMAVRDAAKKLLRDGG